MFAVLTEVWQHHRQQFQNCSETVLFHFRFVVQTAFHSGDSLLKSEQPVCARCLYTHTANRAPLYDNVKAARLSL